MPNRPTLALLALSAILPATLSAQTISAKTAGMKHLDGYLPLDWDAKSGKLYLEIPHLDANGHSQGSRVSPASAFGEATSARTKIETKDARLKKRRLFIFEMWGGKIQRQFRRRCCARHSAYNSAQFGQIITQQGTTSSPTGQRILQGAIKYTF